MATEYSKVFIEQVLAKGFSRNDRSIKVVAEDLKINHHAPKYWMKNKSMIDRSVLAAKEKRTRDGLPKRSCWLCRELMVCPVRIFLQAWCRERGVFTHHPPPGKPFFEQAAKRPRQVRAKCPH